MIKQKKTIKLPLLTGRWTAFFSTLGSFVFRFVPFLASVSCRFFKMNKTSNIKIVK